MELAVYRRETIVNKAKIAVKTNKANNTQMALQKEVGLRRVDGASLSQTTFLSTLPHVLMPARSRTCSARSDSRSQTHRRHRLRSSASTATRWLSSSSSATTRLVCAPTSLPHTPLLCTVPSLWSYLTTGLQQLQEASQALEEQIAELKLQMSRNFDSVMPQQQSHNSIIEYFLREHPEVRIAWCIMLLSLMPSHRCDSPSHRSAQTSMRSPTASQTTASLRCWMYDVNVWDSVEECSISIAVFIVRQRRHRTDA